MQVKYSFPPFIQFSQNSQHNNQLFWTEAHQKSFYTTLKE